MALFKFVDLFAGLGGFHMAAAALGGECVFASEVQEDLRSVYRRNFRIEPAGDINDVCLDDVPSHDLLCAGFPCQPFSKAGAQRGWRDAVRGTVFFRVVEILEARRPEFVLLENVAHFVRHDEGNTYRKVCEALQELEYDVAHRQFSPHQFGVPQIRERMYLVARRRDRGGLASFDWPRVAKQSDLHLSDVLDPAPDDAKEIAPHHLAVLHAWQEFLEIVPATAKLPHFPIWSTEFGATYPYESGSLDKIRIRDLRGFRGSFGRELQGATRKEVYENLPPYALKGDFPKWKQDFIRQNREFYSDHRSRLDRWVSKVTSFDHSFQKFEWNCQGEVRCLWNLVIQFRASGVRVKRPTTAPSLVAMTTSQVPIIGWERRYMTSRECARLQSMDGLQYLPEPESRAFKALGNAVNVLVATSVMRSLLMAAGRVPGGSAIDRGGSSDLVCGGQRNSGVRY